MHHLIYLSQAMRPLSAKALTCLVEQARQANERQHLTGALGYGNKRFISYLIVGLPIPWASMEI